MTSISPLSGIDSLTGLGGAAAPGVATTAPTSGPSFSSVLGGAVDNLSGLQNTADALAVKAVTGDLTDIHQATLAATRAQVTMELVSAVRNKGVEAFNSIMNMQA
ncbi:flagellar hook-basal body complex protein FliE [Amnibacterium kyonggiense]|uniref:Flagellar hook-basal body complex protein FliE n=1 Tax=Amnibacterium kyonggiense TaxID=595671 RepID=A0A4R7FQL2_9MICO|nr:flagellar hook-basal body complex protein FliE [Amnibacterium kyonggiense]TDS80070.1 flagellar hook-basal body complex protein FliE [Amnibacterium kyonggiense]